MTVAVARRSPAARNRCSSAVRARVTARYRDCDGEIREIVVRPGRAGSVLVIDRDAATREDRRLVAHLAADEPRTNASLICRDYLRGDPIGRRCRRVTAADLRAALAEGQARVPESAHADAGDVADAGAETGACELRDRQGRSYALAVLAGEGGSRAQLRWVVGPRAEPDDGCPRQVVSVRTVIARLESYEPMRSLTAAALIRHEHDSRVSVAVLRAELERVDTSAIVLNRGLREAVLAATRRQGLSMSEIARRCGRVKYDARGRASGETSWLARRLGMLPEGGERVPTPWVHSEVLALVARRGLGVSPREVELG